MPFNKKSIYGNIFEADTREAKAFDVTMAKLPNFRGLIFAGAKA